MTSPISLLIPLLQSDWVRLFVDVSLKGVLLLMMAVAIVAALRRASAAARHFIWTLAVIGLLALPLFELALPNLSVPLLPSFSNSKQVPADTERDRGAEGGTNPANAVTTELPRDGDSASKAIDEFFSMPPSKAPLLEESRSGSNLGASYAGHAGRTDWGLALLILWLAGAAVVLTRLALAITKAVLIAGRAEEITANDWRMLTAALARRTGLKKTPKLFRTGEVSMPVTWGVLRPTILLPADAYEWSEDRRAVVLLHELSHVKRADCLTQTLAHIACGLHWFNPFAWSAIVRLRVEREIACDDEVLEAGTRATDYASHLVEIASALKSAALVPPMTVAMACSQLESRVRSILNPTVPRMRLNRLKVVGLCLAALIVVVAIAVIRPSPISAASGRLDVVASASSGAITDEPTRTDLVSTEASASDGSGQIQLDAIAHTIAQRAEADRPLQSDGRGSQRNPGQARSVSAGVGEGTSRAETAAGEGFGRGQGSGESAGQGASKGSATSEGTGSGEGVGQAAARESGKGEGRSGELSAQQIMRLKMHNVTPEFIEAVKKMGFDSASVNQLIQLRIHGIDENFVSQARSWGIDKPTIDQLVRLKMAQMTSDYIVDMKRQGYGELSVTKLAAFKIQGVTPEFAESMRRAGLENLTSDQLLNLKMRGVTEDFIREAQTWGFGKLSARELIDIKLFKISPDVIVEMRSVGFDNLPLFKLIQTKMHGVTPEFIKEIRGFGFEDLTIDKLLRMKIQGITGDYIRKMMAAGFKHVSIDKMIEMKVSGIDEILLRNRR